MKKVLITIGNMNVGGIQKSLLELLKALSQCPEYEVSLFCCKKVGAFLERIPESISILPENPYAAAAEQTLAECKEQGKKYYFFRMIMSLWSKLFTKEIPSTVLCKLIGNIGEEYDVSISYSQPIEDHAFCNLTNEIVLNCTRAAQKITFVHCDFGVYGGNTKRNRKLYARFDRIAAVSESVGKRFAEIVPVCSGKLHTVYNFCDCNEIEQLAAQDPLIYTKKTFISVARLSEEKGILRCIPIFNKLKNDGFDFEWHIVGDGPIRHQIETEIDRYGLAEDIILEGEQMNPYRYMKHAAFFLLPSFHEAAPVVFDEALALGLPVLTTKTLSAEEIVGNPGHGYVCEQTEEAIYQMLREALSGTLQYALHEKPNQALSAAQFDAVCG